MTFFDDIFNALIGSFTYLVNYIIQSLLNFFLPFYSWVLAQIQSIYNFISMIFTLGFAVYDLTWGLLGDVYATNPYAALFLSLILFSLSYVIFATIWNVVADIEIFGWKIPRLPL